MNERIANYAKESASYKTMFEQTGNKFFRQRQRYYERRLINMANDLIHKAS